MTIARVVPVVSALLALGAGQAPTEPPAALRRPHLQVLTKVPESQLFPMMNAIADSLGVRCDYCHVRSAGSDQDVVAGRRMDLGPRRQAAQARRQRDDADGG
jgi:hypothetical protein